MTKKIIDIIGAIDEPMLGGTLGDNDIIAQCHGDDDNARIVLRFPYPAIAIQSAIKAECQRRLSASGINADIAAGFVIHARTVQGGVSLINGVKNIIAVASAKGGVGKSTTAANLALALSAQGARVGILDADIYGPSLPVMLGVNHRPDGDDKGITPLSAHGLQLMSIGYLVGEDQPMIWRGPMATKALMQLLRETKWDNVDYLFLDMPPGTGDIQLTIAQQAPVTGAVIITTPQDLSMTDAKRGLMMFNKVSIPVLGIVENMSVYICPQCGAQDTIFGSGAGEKLASDHNAELLGKLPLDAAIRAAADNGKPSVIAEPDSAASNLYQQTAIRIAAKTAKKPRDRTSAFPKIVIDK